MIGGSAEAVARATPLLATFSRRQFHIGGNGRASELKLVVNLVLGLNRAALAEGLSFARELGFDLPLVLDVLRSGAAYSRAMDTKGPKMLAEDFRPQARLSQHRKDVQLMLAAAAGLGLRLPLSDAHVGLLEAAEMAGYGESDNSAIIIAYRTPNDRSAGEVGASAGAEP
jgi:3-hydroxyisobutyrate dehydrogenase-like beta-hydroxyacid dehydrogenase